MGGLVSDTEDEGEEDMQITRDNLLYLTTLHMHIFLTKVIDRIKNMLDVYKFYIQGYTCLLLGKESGYHRISQFNLLS